MTSVGPVARTNGRATGYGVSKIKLLGTRCKLQGLTAFWNLISPTRSRTLVPARADPNREAKHALLMG